MSARATRSSSNHANTASSSSSANHRARKRKAATADARSDVTSHEPPSSAVSSSSSAEHPSLRRSQRLCVSSATRPVTSSPSKMGRNNRQNKNPPNKNDLDDDDEFNDNDVNMIRVNKTKQAKKASPKRNKMASSSNPAPPIDSDNLPDDQQADQHDGGDDTDMDEFMAAILRAANSGAPGDASSSTLSRDEQRAALLDAVFGGNPSPASGQSSSGLRNAFLAASSSSSSSGTAVDARSYVGQSSGRYKDLLLQIKSRDDTIQMIALQELAELLGVATEDMFIGYGRTRMAGFDTREYVYALISLLKPSRANADLDPFMMDEDDFEFGGMGGGGGGALAGEVMLLACRCLSNLIEANPSALAHLCGSGCDGVAVLVDKLQAVEYIELAEQVLAVLEKVCNEYPSLIVKENGLHACLQYLDFFSLHVQRMAVGIVAKSCRGLGILSDGNDRTQEILQKLSPVLPVLETLLTTNADPKLVESSIRALDAIVAAAARSESVLESLVTPPLLRALVSALKPPSSTGGAAAAGTPVGSVRASVTSPGAIGPSQQQGSAGNFSTLVKMLVAVCKGSAGLCAQLVGEVGGPVVIFAYLTGVTDGSCGTGGQGSVVERIVGRPAEEVLQVLVLAGEMVPALGREGVWCMRKEPEKQTVTAASAGRSKKKKEAVPLEPQSFDTRKRGVLKEDTAVQEYALRLLPVMMEVFGTSVHAGVKKLAVEAAAKCVLCVEDAGILNATLLAGGFGRFVYELLNARVVAFGEAAPAAERGEALVFCAAGVQITRVVVDKCGGGVVGVLLREGILSEVRKCVEVLEKVVSMNEDVAEEVVSTPPTSEGRVLRSRKSDDKGKSVNPSPSRASLAPIDPSTAGISTGFFEGMRQALGKMTGTQAATQHAAVSGACPQLTIIGLNGQRYTEDEVRDWLLQVSTDFLKDMGENKALFGGSGDASFDVLGDLKKACNILKGTKVSLKAPIKGSASDSVAFSDSLMLEELQRIADNFAGQRGHGGVTGFEVLESGIVDALTAYLTCAGDRETNDALYRAGLLDRLRAFLHVFMDGVNPNVSAGSQYVPHAFRQLVGRLQECLSRVEEFELTQAVPAGAGSGLGPSEALLSMLGGGSGLSFGGNAREQANPALQLSRQIRVKLMAEEPETVPASYRGVVVSIHAIATVKAFEDFLKGKLGSITPGAAGKIVGEGDSSEEEREEGEAVIDEDDDDNQDEDEDDEERDDAGNQLVDLMETDEEGISPSTLSPSTTVHVIGSEPVSLAHSSQAPSSSPTPPTAAVAPGASLSEPRSYASATIASQNAYKIIFTLGDRVLSKDETIFGALYTHEQLNLDKDGSNHTNANIWGKIFTIKYKRVQNAGEMGHPTMEGALKADLSSSSHLPFKVPFSMERPSAISKESSAGRVAFLLRILAALNTRWNEIYDEHHASSHIAKLIPVAGVATAADGATGIPITTDVASSSSVLSPIPPSSFINSKITSKLNKQLNEPLIVASGVLPPWCNAVACDYSFLVPFETRLLYLQSTAFGYARSIGRWKQTDGQQDNGRFRGGMDPASMIGRIQRQKVRISRARIVDSMIRVMESYGSSNTMIEVEFFDEVGTGLGPTLEFYSTVCKELRRRAGCSVSGDGEGAGSPSRASAISLWRENGVADEFLNPAEGLFPGPLSGDMAETEAGRKRLMVFKAIGTFIAKSLLDGRIVDMPFSPLFLELVVRGDNALKCASTLSLLHLMKNADKSLFASLSDVFKYAQAKTIIDTNAALSESQKKTALANVTVKDVRIDDLCLDFTLPGYPDVELKSDGTETSISLENVGDYVEKVVDMTVRSGIQRQTQAFREGFNHVFPISRLKCFSVEELCLILGGSHEEDWSFLTIRDSIKADHGFTSDSKTVENLVLMLESFNLLERREFLMFVTGSAKLPIGGFKALNPPLTVVQKGSEFGSQADAYLPSVMTCVNYLKVPAYSDLAVMRQRFGLAMKEGQGSFHLS